MNTSFQKCKNTSDEWYTPPEIIQALGKFDLDPCAPTSNFYTAERCLTKEIDGLRCEWCGRVWLNPPYSRKLIGPFMKKMVEHNNGIALIFNRMDIAMWHDLIFPNASAMLIIRGRLRFWKPDYTQGDAAGCGSVLVAFGNDNAESLRQSKIPGKYIALNPSPKTK